MKGIDITKGKCSGFLDLEIKSLNDPENIQSESLTDDEAGEKGPFEIVCNYSNYIYIYIYTNLLLSFHLVQNCLNNKSDPKILKSARVACRDFARILIPRV